MRREIASIAVLIIGMSSAMADNIPLSPNRTIEKAPTLWLAGEDVGKGTKKKPPVKVPPPKKTPPPGAHDATKGQTGRCICSTNAQGNTTCTGAC